jgi:hypothetical protein
LSGRPASKTRTRRRTGARKRCGGYLDGYIESFPDLHIEATECFAVGNDGVLTTNHFSGHSANGVRMDRLLTTISTYEEGLVVRVAEYFHRQEAFEAVGLSE